MKKITLKLLNIYKIFISGGLELVFGKGCRYTPTCSQYAATAITKYGIFKGSYLTLKRLGRCQPFGGFGFDPVK